MLRPCSCSTTTWGVSYKAARETAIALLSAKPSRGNDMPALLVAPILIWLGWARLPAIVESLSDRNNLRAVEKRYLSAAARSFQPCKMA